MQLDTLSWAWSLPSTPVHQALGGWPSRTWVRSSSGRPWEEGQLTVTHHLAREAFQRMKGM